MADLIPPTKPVVGVDARTRSIKKHLGLRKGKYVSAVGALWGAFRIRWWSFHESGAISYISRNDRLRGFRLDVEGALFFVQTDFPHCIGQDRVVPWVKTIGTCHK